MIRLFKTTSTILAVLIAVHSSLADEGMWFPISISKSLYADMEELGLELTPEQIYSVNQSSIKDAIVSLGGFCTAEVISKQGLLLTNHHCAESAIQSHSSVENDYLKNGFWAQTMEDELPNEGLYARFLIRMEDVTDEVLSAVEKSMTEDERNAAIAANTSRLRDEAVADSHYTAEVKPSYEGNKYYLFVYETYYDVRLVGAPPASIGFYGGETDNWTWPRHTGDFALFRIYAGPDGKPAPYSPENAPLKPKRHLPISLEGYQEGDFAMVMGFPGSTKRYIASYGLQLAVDQTNPAMIRLMDRRQRILNEAMETSDELRIKYHSKFFKIANALKYYRGQTQEIKDRGLIEKRKNLENDFQTWVERKKKREELYGESLNEISAAYDSISKYNRALVYSQFMNVLVESIPFANGFSSLAAALEIPENGEENVRDETIDKAVEAIKASAEEFFEDYHAPIDQEVFSALMKLYRDNVDPAFQPGFLTEVSDLDEWADSVYQASIFSDRGRLMAFLENPSSERLLSDPLYQIAESIRQNSGEMRNLLNEPLSRLSRANRLFVRGLMEMQPDKNFYPDANSTLRLSYGTVKGYSPRDAVVYRHYTTAEGLQEKHTPGDDEFEAPEKLLRLFEDDDFDVYGSGGVMKLNFTSNNDITGGNSGSPVLNGRGELIGIAFDGNWEAMSSDIAYVPDLQRMISVDIRYALYVIDKFAEARHLIDEMTLAGKGEETPEPAGVAR